MSSLLLLKAVVLLGLGLWLALIAVNNVMDPKTNLTLLGKMLTMQGVHRDSEMGSGLVHRAVRDTRAPKAILLLVVVYQALTTLALLHGAYRLLAVSITSGGQLQAATSAANLALTLLAGMWIQFLIGGLWFGYWITLPAVQSVHISMLIATIALATFVNI